MQAHTTTSRASLTIPIRRLEGTSDLPFPAHITPGSAGLDLTAAVTEPLTIAPGGFDIVPTGIQIALPLGYEAQVRSRSGLAFKHGIFALNAPGTVDSDYRGEIKVILANFGKEEFTISRGDRIAQMVVSRYERVSWSEVSDLEATERGEGGFGSTGI